MELEGGILCRWFEMVRGDRGFSRWNQRGGILCRWIGVERVEEIDWC